MVGALRPSRLSICPSSAFMPSASSTTGTFRSSSRERTSRSVRGARPSPGPMSTPSQDDARLRISSYRAGRGKGMASRHFTAAMGQISSGTPRTAPEAASTGAPV